MYWNIWAWSSYYSISTRISMTNVLKKIEVKLELLTDIDMLLMVEKRISGGICRYINMQQQTIDTWNIITKIKIYHILYTGVQRNCMNEQCLKNDLLIVLIGKKHIKIPWTFYNKSTMKIIIKGTFLSRCWIS